MSFFVKLTIDILQNTDFLQATVRNMSQLVLLCYDTFVLEIDTLLEFFFGTSMKNFTMQGNFWRTLRLIYVLLKSETCPAKTCSHSMKHSSICALN